MRAFLLFAFAFTAYLCVVERCQVVATRADAAYEHARADFAFAKAKAFAIDANINRDAALGNAALYAQCIGRRVVSAP